MSIFNKSLRTSWALWAFLSVVLFVLLGFVNPLPEDKFGFTYWGMWAIFLRGEWFCSWGEIISQLVFVAFVWAVPAVVVGWVVQASVVAGMAGIRTLGTRKPT